jgi:hypothetical protein
MTFNNNNMPASGAACCWQKKPSDRAEADVLGKRIVSYETTTPTNDWSQ